MSSSASADEEADLDGDEMLMQSRKRKRKGRTAIGTLPADLAGKLGEAHLQFIDGKYTEAIVLLEDVIRHAPECAEPYLTMGTVYEQMSQPAKALQFQITAAHLSRNDVELWRRVGLLAREQGHLTQAVDLFDKVLKLNNKDVPAITARATILAEAGKWDRARLDFSQLRRLQPDVTAHAMGLAQANLRTGQTEAAAVVLRDVVASWADEHPAASGVGAAQGGGSAGATASEPNEPNEPNAAGLHAMTLLTEILIQRGDRAALVDAVTLIEQGQEVLSKQSGNEQLPAELAIRYGIAKARLTPESEQLAADAARCLSHVLQLDPSGWRHMYEDVAAAWAAAGRPQRAAEVLQRLLQSGGGESEAGGSSSGITGGAIAQSTGAVTWAKLGEYRAAAGQTEQAVGCLQRALDAAPHNLHAAATLARVWQQAEADGAALSVLRTALGAATVRLLSRQQEQEEAGPSAGPGRAAAETPTAVEETTQLALVLVPSLSAAAADPVAFTSTEAGSAAGVNRDAAQLFPVALQCARLLESMGQYRAVLAGLGPLMGLPADPATAAGGADEDQNAEVVLATAAIERAVALSLAGRGGGPPAGATLPVLLAHATNVAKLDGAHLAEMVHCACCTLVALGRTSTAEVVISSALALKPTPFLLHDEGYHRLHIMAVELAGSAEVAFDSVKFLVSHYKESGALWNKLFRVVPSTPGSGSVFVKLRKSGAAESAALLLAEGHALAAAISRDSTSLSTASAALSKYHEAYKLAPHEPLVSLCAGISSLHLVSMDIDSTQQAGRAKVDAVVQAFAFLQKYAQALHEFHCATPFGTWMARQEALFNVGRACHHLGLLHLAEGYYETVASEAFDEDSAANTGDGAGCAIGLRREAAYNLSLIYRSSNSPALAREALSLVPALS